MKIFYLFISFIFLSYSVSFGEVLFQDNYDNHDNWSITQTTSDYSHCWPDAYDFPSANPTSGPRYFGWNSSRTYLTGGQGVGHNTLIIDSTSKRGATGKGVTYWCEVPDYNQPFEASDATLYITLTDTPGDYGYDEIWIQVWRKFQPGFYTDQYGHKFIHASYYAGAGFNLNKWFPTSDANLSHAPCIVGGTTGYGYTDGSGNKLRVNYMLMKLRPFADRSDYKPNTGGNLECGITNHYPAGSTSYTQILLKNSGTREGGWQNPGNYGDGDWHYHEYYLKMNSAPGAADGIYAYYIDGVCQARYINVPWVVSGEMVGWNMVALGGNNDYQDTVSGGYEVYYVWDDLIISTSRMPGSPSPPKNLRIK